MNRPDGIAGGERVTHANELRAVLVLLALYALGFALFWPRGITVNDEASYVRAAAAYAEGSSTITTRDGLTGIVEQIPPGFYPPGTAILQAPFVRLAGISGAPVSSLLCFCVTALLLVCWLYREGRSPLFALLFIGYLPAVVLGRVAMSDVPSALVVCAAQILLFTHEPTPKGLASSVRAFLAGLLCGVSLLFRETNALFVAPLFLGAVLRREGRTLPLSLGALAGVGLRLLASELAFGSALFTKDHGYGWSAEWAISHVPLYLGALVILAPFGLIGGLLYRGRRRPEVIATTLLVLGFFLAYGYSGEESGFFKRLVLGPRYFIPLIPLLAVALSEVLPRLWHRAGAPGGPRLRRASAFAWVGCVAMEVIAVHPVLWRFQRDQNQLATALCAATTNKEAVLLDQVESGKYLAACDGARSQVDFARAAPAELPRLVARDGSAAIALLEREDSAFHRARKEEDARWVAAAGLLCRLSTILDSRYGDVRIIVLAASNCSPAPPR